MKWMPPKPNPTEGYLSEPKLSYEVFNEWYDSTIRPLFENAKIVYGRIDGNYGWFDNGYTESTDKALLINITPIKEESAEDILKELTEKMSYLNENSFPWNEAFKKAKAYLERKK